MSKPIHQLLAEHNITDVTTDSRQVKAGSAFIAVRGSLLDGNKFIDDALNNGANLIISDDNSQQMQEKLHIVKDTTIALSEAASYLYPITDVKIVAVTGTNGKTSITHFYMQILEQIGVPAATIGTVGIYCFDGSKTTHEALPGNLTTPDTLTLYQTIHRLANKGIKHIAIEASSHGLQQKRLWGVPISAAAFSSFSHDHLDYHNTVENYLSAKMQLFGPYTRSGTPCYISNSIPHYHDIKNQIIQANKPCIVVGDSQDCDILIQNYHETITAMEADIAYAGNIYHLTNSLIGKFQISNALLAWLLADATTDQPLDPSPLEKLHNIPGRMERISNPNSSKHVFVDFAHTPDSLLNSLQSLKPLCRAKLIVVFGCGGDRDTSKRPLMGQIAAEIADTVIVTDDNPRGENPALIRQEIIQSAPNALEIGDRKEAITRAIDLMDNNDILLIAGKGHETYQIIGDQILELDDRQIVRDKLSK